jgi:hypothetical protein
LINIKKIVDDHLAFMFGIQFSTGPFKEYSSYRSIQGVFQLQVHSRNIPAPGPFKEYSSYRSIQGVFQLQVHSRSIPAPGPLDLELEYSLNGPEAGILLEWTWSWNTP